MIKRLTTLNLLVLILTSCEPAGTYSYYVDNKSNYTFRVKIEGARYLQEEADSIISISAQSKTRFCHFTERNHGDWGNVFLKAVFDTVHILPDDSSVKLNKDFQSRDNWDLRSENTRNATFEYTFTITSENISIQDN